MIYYLVNQTFPNYYDGVKDSQILVNHLRDILELPYVKRVFLVDDFSHYKISVVDDGHGTRHEYFILTAYYTGGTKSQVCSFRPIDLYISSISYHMDGKTTDENMESVTMVGNNKHCRTSPDYGDINYWSSINTKDVDILLSDVLDGYLPVLIKEDA